MSLKVIKKINIWIAIALLTACGYTTDNLTTQRDFVKVVAGGDHDIALTSTGRVFTWGQNWRGQLGDGTLEDRVLPNEITQQFNLSLDEIIIDVEAYFIDNIALSSTGRVFSWGDGDRIIPTEITQTFNLQSKEIIIKISSNNAITSIGRVFAWGWNDRGQLGDGTTISKKKPIEITQNFNLQAKDSIIEIKSGMALSSTGRVFTWGDNRYGELGTGTTVGQPYPVEITQNFNLKQGEIIEQISVRGYNCYAISSTSRVFSWGSNQFGQVGDGTTIDKALPTEITHNFNLLSGETIVAIENGLAISSMSRIFSWGYNRLGTIGNGTKDHVNSTPVEITQNFRLEAGETIVKIDTQYDRKLAISSTGSIFRWGENRERDYSSLYPARMTIKSKTQG